MEDKRCSELNELIEMCKQKKEEAEKFAVDSEYLRFISYPEYQLGLLESVTGIYLIAYYIRNVSKFYSEAIANKHGEIFYLVVSGKITPLDGYTRYNMFCSFILKEMLRNGES